MPAATIFALASGRPPAAIAIIRISGPQAHAAGKSIAGSLPEARSAGLRELRHPASHELLDRALVLRFDGPESSTGEDVVEFHCHGGRAIVEAVLGALSDCDGLRLARPGEFTRRAFESGRIDLTEAEGLADLIEAETQSQRRAALLSAEGGLSRRIDEWQTRLLQLSARAEHAIDYADDEGRVDLRLCRDCAALSEELEAELARPKIEPLMEGLKVVIGGPPNAGKSSLINALVGHERAIVTDRPGTTRDHIDVPLALEGLPVVLTDTAGLRDSTADEAEAIGIAKARRLVDAADIHLWLGEPGAEPAHPRTVRVHSKSDLPDRVAAPPGSLAVSARTGKGLADLLARIRELAADLIPAEDAVALNRRQSGCLRDAADALSDAARAEDAAIVADCIRIARAAMDRLTGRAGVEDLLDTLFGRFCLGK